MPFAFRFPVLFLPVTGLLFCGCSTVIDSHAQKAPAVAAWQAGNYPRTAELLDVMMIIFVRGKLPNEEVLNMAEDAGIAVVMTEYTLYDACGRLYAAGLPGGTGRRKP